jgi:hypothetical protein
MKQITIKYFTMNNLLLCIKGTIQVNKNQFVFLLSVILYTLLLFALIFVKEEYNSNGAYPLLLWGLIMLLILALGTKSAYRLLTK